MPDAPAAEPHDAVEQMRAATDRLRDQAWKVVHLPSDEQTEAPSTSG